MLKPGSCPASFRIPLALLLAAGSCAAQACDSGDAVIFGCEASNGRKFIELCASSPIARETGRLRYRFGALDSSGSEAAVELEYPRDDADSFSRFFGATYTHRGIYTQSLRFESGAYGYTVYTRTRGMRDLGAGVEVTDRRSGKTKQVECSERPRFYIHELKDVVACDTRTPVGKACIK